MSRRSGCRGRHVRLPRRKRRPRTWNNRWLSPARSFLQSPGSAGQFCNVRQSLEFRIVFFFLGGGITIMNYESAYGITKALLAFCHSFHFIFTSSRHTMLTYTTRGIPSCCPLGYRAEIRTRACLTASRRSTVWTTPHPIWATPHPADYWLLIPAQRYYFQDNFSHG